ncbi:hypothetical protein ACPA54_27625 [Uniformispora flossi]|uniref:hypothetical protein n=1 Tax=Uniformispora flossi TaxID=3390723 RepID=UPI003C2ED572
MPNTQVHEPGQQESHEDVHVVLSPERVIVTGRDMHPSDEDVTSEQTSHASETSQAEGARTDD